jgi:hypothetical protein
MADDGISEGWRRLQMPDDVHAATGEDLRFKGEALSSGHFL